VDPKARFVFVGDAEDVPGDATPFDVPGAELSHHGDDCTFETLLERYELDDPALAAIGRAVHEADLGDDRFDAPEAPGLDVRLRLPIVLATTALVVAVFGWTPLGQAAQNLAGKVIPPLAKKANFAKNAGAVTGIKASRKPKANYLVPLTKTGKFPISVGQVG